jgi:hypothetical protein
MRHARAFSAAAGLAACLAVLTACGSETEPAAAPPVAPEPPTTTDAVTTPEPEPVTTEPATTEAEPEAVPPAATEPATTMKEEPAAEPLPGLPAYTAGYRDWLRLNEEPIPPNPEGDAHLGTKNVYASQEADRSYGQLVYPDGTIIVKEGMRPDTSFVGLIAVMRKKKGADPEHNDWVFVEWTRSSPTEPFEEIAADAVCWSCHMNAADTDYVWVHTLGSAP